MQEVIRQMPQTDHPLAFGQHSNSDMAASIDDANTLIDVLVSLQPRVVKVRDREKKNTHTHTNHKPLPRQRL